MNPQAKTTSAGVVSTPQDWYPPPKYPEVTRLGWIVAASRLLEDRFTLLDRFEHRDVLDRRRLDLQWILIQDD